MFTTRFLDIPPLGAVAGTVRVPGSKSISNRALLLAGFAAGATRIEGLLHSDDTHVMIEALQQLGCRIEGDGDAILVTGLGARPLTQQSILWLGNAGTAMRPLVAALALGAAPRARFEFRGTPRMHERPIGDLDSRSGRTRALRQGEQQRGEELARDVAAHDDRPVQVERCRRRVDDERRKARLLEVLDRAAERSNTSSGRGSRRSSFTRRRRRSTSTGRSSSAATSRASSSPRSCSPCRNEPALPERLSTSPAS